MRVRGRRETIICSSQRSSTRSSRSRADVSDLAEVVGAEALNEAEARYLGFAEAFQVGFVQQGADELRSLEETLDRGWQVASVMPRPELTMVSEAMLDLHYRGGTMPLRVPPGRAGRLWLVRRLEIARRGVNVLDQKRQALVREAADSPSA